MRKWTFPVPASRIGTNRDSISYYCVMNDDNGHHAKLAALRKELEAIHIANKVHWNRKEHNHEADMEHQLRKERLDQIRKEMDELENG